MTKDQYQIGMVGLGVMGCNLLLNMADHGYAVVGYDKDSNKVKALRSEAEDRPIKGVENVTDFIALLHKPRVVMLLVPAGKIVDAVISDLLPHLETGDLVIDAGNSHFNDTDRRQKELESKGLHFFGMGVSGGESGARHGPSMMPGGPQQAYSVVRPILEACAANVDGEPCVTYLGPRSAGHYVKMVHNGIEYGIMQLIAESYDLLKRGLGLRNDELSALFTEWNRVELNSFLMEITADIFQKVDKETGQHLVDLILDVARQKGTGEWTTQDALELHVPTPTVDMAVAMRNLSGQEEERASMAKKFTPPQAAYQENRDEMIEHLRRALYASTILTYAQGTEQLRAASQEYGYNLDLSAIARIWRGGCIIRSALLEPIYLAYEREPQVPHLLLDDLLGNAVSERIEDLRFVIKAAIELQLPASALMSCLAYYDGLHSGHLPANLIQAQRDYFGAHTYERIDKSGTFHTEWISK